MYFSGVHQSCNRIASEGFLASRGGLWVSAGHGGLRIFDSGLDVLLPVEMRNGRGGCGLVESQRILRSVQALQAEPGCAELRSQRLPVGG